MNRWPWPSRPFGHLESGTSFLYTDLGRARGIIRLNVLLLSLKTWLWTPKLSLYEKYYEVTAFLGYGNSQIIAITDILRKPIFGDFVPGYYVGNPSNFFENVNFLHFSRLNSNTPGLLLLVSRTLKISIISLHQVADQSYRSKSLRILCIDSKFDGVKQIAIYNAHVQPTVGFYWTLHFINVGGPRLSSFSERLVFRYDKKAVACFLLW